ncbi:MAG: glycosyltransferase family 2 protein, partial [Spirochaetes bacterium]|nr:glycosyltransferase family 2 protein [Spirochaetota bacterium]
MLSIIIVNYKSSQDIEACLASIMAHEPGYRDYEFIIVDNNSGDTGLDGLKSRYPFVKILNAPRNGGFAYGNNYGLHEAAGDVILFLNPDTYVKDDSIGKLYGRLMRGSDVDMIGPKLLFPDNTNQSFFLPQSYLTLWKLFCEQFFLYRIFKSNKIFNSYYRTWMDYDMESCVEQISGAALMFRRDILETTGVMDEKYFMYFEESDFCYQAVKCGCRLLYYPESRIYHTGGLVSPPAWERSTKYFVTSFKYYFTKNFGRPACIFASAIYLVGSLLRAFGLRIRGNDRYRYYIFHAKNVITIRRR